MLTRIFSIVVFVSLSGCAFHQKPYVMYDGSVPLSNTAVFASFDTTSSTPHDSRIQTADGKKTSCIQVGCPYWVRVLPGRHSFDVHYMSHIAMTGHRFADFHVVVPEMKPRHVYVTRYREIGERVSVAVEDLGENPQFGVSLGLKGLNNNYYPVEF
ncbi:MAG: hypothetical protein QM639_00010 [Rhodocyclaceae bacterium]